MNENEQTILNGVVRILEHLIPKHKDDVCKVMMEMFKVYEPSTPYCNTFFSKNYGPFLFYCVMPV